MADDAPFRRPGKAVSPALARLAEQSARRARDLPRDAERLSAEERRVVLEKVFGADEDSNATNVIVASSLIWSLVFVFCLQNSTVSGNPAPILGVLLSGLPFAWWIAHLSKWRAARRAETIAARLAWAARQPFPVHGYELWCLSHEPLLDVTLSIPIDPRQLADALAAIAPAVALSWMDERTARLRIPPTLVTRVQGPTGRYANPGALELLVERLLIPLHSDVPIERMDMGGARD